MTTGTKTDDIECADKRDGKGQREKEGEKGNDEKGRERDGFTPESNKEERWKGQSAREERERSRRRDRNGGVSDIQFNFLRNSLVFEIQPPKGCA